MNRTVENQIICIEYMAWYLNVNPVGILYLFSEYPSFRRAIIKASKKPEFHFTGITELYNFIYGYNFDD